MTYELAKELKDAGFRFDFCNDGEEVHFKECFPSLSQLIEACGEFKSLDFYKARKRTGEWRAQARLHCGFGPTPEEAVAKLWLALQKK